MADEASYDSLGGGAAWQVLRGFSSRLTPDQDEIIHAPDTDARSICVEGLNRLLEGSYAEDWTRDFHLNNAVLVPCLRDVAQRASARLAES